MNTIEPNTFRAGADLIREGFRIDLLARTMGEKPSVDMTL
jgi:hypothetical protein